ncbi:aminotransferase class I/II-fold pyridoxal phosphate-dependent enzyme [Verrucomicrobiaceae bacterium N1E253]|uniref:Aminotransferase class I/II-fold pyridoxal phosphate-dependent enzyme n=1 Tax=Oceaniferula marina TaxID=2748318 RepID=A0A851GKC3_9BACT|nr:aminotransferase class I/II-fold pyridoxal phosphate-dependent enzyme [Oceaniferula marina]NWK55170.1 aminotransferase class I/II-fold pyridoxal phosphate-dependent enzyme [Oceaniferula marina]
MDKEDFIPLSVPVLGGNALPYVSECVETEWVSYVGGYVSRFEDDLAVCSGAPHVAAMNSGTSALHIALILAGVGEDDEVVMPAITFVSPANAVRYCGAWPVFVDISSDDWQLDVDEVERFLEHNCESRDGGLFNKITGRRVAALLPVHLLGGLADVDRLAALAQRYDLPLIEDAAEALGAEYKGRKVAEPLPCYPDVRRFVATSFNGNKIITTGGGGALFTYSEGDSTRAKHLSTTAKTDPVEFIHDEVGYNYRMTNMAAALGCAQLEQLDEHIVRKRAIARRYAEQLGNHSCIRIMPGSTDVKATYWLYTVELLGREVMPVIEQLGKKWIQARPLWKPMPQLTYLSKKCHTEEYAVGAALQRCAISLPCSVSLGEDAQQRVSDCLVRILDHE